MSATLPREPVPRLPLVLMGLLIAGAVAFAGIARREQTAPAPTDRIIAARSLHVADGPAGSVIVTDAKTGQVIQSVASGDDNFLRITLRTLAQTRIHRGIGAAPPFTLTAYADGREILADPSTGRRIDLEAFGPDNEADFTRLLPQGKAP